MPEHDQIDRQPLGIRHDLIEGVAACQVAIARHAARLQPLERLVQELAILTGFLDEAGIPDGAGLDGRIRDAARNDREHVDLGAE